MPIVPSERSGISMDVPVANVPVGQFGAVGSAIAQTGAFVAGEGMKIYEAIRKEEAHDIVQKRAMDERLEADNYLRMISSKSKDGYFYEDVMGRDEKGQPVVVGQEQVLNKYTKNPMTIGEHFREWSNSKYEKSQADMPNNYAQSLYKNEMGGFYTGKISSALNIEMEKKTEASKVEYARQFQVLKNAVVDVPDVNAVYTNADRIKMALVRKGQNGFLPMSEVEPMFNKEISDVAQNYFNGRIINSKVLTEADSVGRVSKLQGVLDELRGNMKTSDPVAAASMRQSAQRRALKLYTVTDSLTPDQKATLEKTLIAELEHAQKKDTATYRNRAGSQLDALARGKDVNLSDLTRNVMNGWKNPDERVELMVRGYGISTFNKISNSEAFRLATPQKQMEMISAERGKIEGFTETYFQQLKASSPNLKRAEVAQGIYKWFDDASGGFVKHLENEKQQDQGGYFQKSDTEINSLMTGVSPNDLNSISGKGERIQQARKLTRMLVKEHGLDEEILTGNDYIGGWATQLSRVKDVEEGARLITMMREELGPEFSGVMSQMTRSKKLSDKWNSAALLSNSTLKTQDIVRGILFMDSLEKEDKERFKTTVENVAPAISEYLDGFVNNYPDSLKAREARSAFASAVIALAVDGKTYGDMSDSDVKKAAQAWFRGSIGYPERVNNVNIVVPKFINGTPILEKDIPTIKRNLIGLFGEQSLGRAGVTDTKSKPEQLKYLYTQMASQGYPIFQNVDGVDKVGWRWMGNIVGSGGASGHRDMVRKHRGPPYPIDSTEVLWIDASELLKDPYRNTENKPTKGVGKAKEFILGR